MVRNWYFTPIMIIYKSNVFVCVCVLFVVVVVFFNNKIIKHATESKKKKINERKGKILQLLLDTLKIRRV